MSTDLDDRPVTLVDENLDRVLRALPRAASGPAFRAAVLARAADAARRRGQRRRRLVPLAAGALALAVALGAWSLETARMRAERRAALVDEHRRLLSELDDLRELAASRSQIRLGGDATTDLYLDLATVPAVAAAKTSHPETDRTRSHG